MIMMHARYYNISCCLLATQMCLLTGQMYLINVRDIEWKKYIWCLIGRAQLCSRWLHLDQKIRIFHLHLSKNCHNSQKIIVHNRNYKVLTTTISLYMFLILPTIHIMKIVQKISIYRYITYKCHYENILDQLQL